MTTGFAAAPPGVRTARRTHGLAFEGAFEVAGRVQRLTAAGRDIANLAIGEPDFPTPGHVVAAGIKALRAGETRYAPPAGIPALRSAIATALTRRGVRATPERVIVTPGAKTALWYAILATVERGDEVLIPDPGFPAFASAVRFAGGAAVPYGLDAAQGFQPDVAQIAERITPRTRVMILNSPNNPTGGTIDRGGLERIAALALEHNLVVISDEIYSRLAHTGEGEAPSIAAVGGMADRTIVVDGFSKAWSMTGWRLGYAFVPASLARTIETIAVNAHSCVPGFIQYAGVAALTGPEDALRAVRRELRRRRDALVEGLRAIPGVRCARPGGGFFAFPDVSDLLALSGETSEQFATRLLDRFGVAAVPGTAFGAQGEGFIRLSYASPAPDIASALGRLRSAARTTVRSGGPSQ
jgi:aspartate/methionine/tyrosine aminotransferase